MYDLYIHDTEAGGNVFAETFYTLDEAEYEGAAIVKEYDFAESSTVEYNPNACDF